MNQHLKMKIKKINKKATYALTSELRKKICPRSKRAQEEMIGFALIIIIVAVILLVFLSIFINKSRDEVLGDNEIDSFVQASLSYTTNCKENLNSFYSIQDLITECFNYDSTCLNGRSTCEVLNEDLEGILDESWKITSNSAIKGYKFYASVNNEPVISIEKGNVTSDYRGSSQHLPQGDIFLTVYY